MVWRGGGGTNNPFLLSYPATVIWLCPHYNDPVHTCSHPPLPFRASSRLSTPRAHKAAAAWASPDRSLLRGEARGAEEMEGTAAVGETGAVPRQAAGRLRHHARGEHAGEGGTEGRGGQKGAHEASAALRQEAGRRKNRAGGRGGGRTGERGRRGGGRGGGGHCICEMRDPPHYPLS